MPVRLQVGGSAPVSIEVRDDVWVQYEDPSGVEPLSDFTAATCEALAGPLGYPPLKQAIVPGDVVAIALGEGVRGAADVIIGILKVLKAAEVSTSDVCVVVGSTGEEHLLRLELADQVAEGLRILAHDPNNASQLVFVAAMDDRPLRFNRHLGEADVVIPVGCARHNQGLSVRGPYEVLYPRFADADTIARHQRASISADPQEVADLKTETAQVGALLGAGLVVQAVPAREGGLAAVLAGLPELVSGRAASLCKREWDIAIDRKANLVITTLGGDQKEQTWENVARAVHAARRAADESQGAIVVCTELDEEPGPAIRQLGQVRDGAFPLTAFSGMVTDDAVWAWELLQALEQGPVYFMSRLAKETVEEIGMAPIEDFDELTRLVERSCSCFMMNNAQHAVPVVVEEANSTPTN